MYRCPGWAYGTSEVGSELILLTGATGYIGPVVAKYLREIGFSEPIRGIDTGFFLAQQDGGLRSPETYLDELKFVDVRDLVAEDFDGVSAVVHLAAISNDPMGDRFADVTYDINRDQTVRLAKLAKAAGVNSFIFASSGSVYGAGGEGARDETSELFPQTAYAKSKIESENLLAELAADDFLVTSLRFSTACGWSPRVRLDLVLNDFVASALTTGQVTVLSDGSPWRPLIHVTDMARAIHWALTERPERVDVNNFVVNVGADDWNFQVKDLANAVGKAIPGTKISINSGAPADKRSYRLDFSRWAECAPNHQSVRTLDDAIAELATNMAVLQGLDGDFRTSTRTRLVALNALREQGSLTDNLRWV